MKKHLKYIEGNSDKFWQIEVQGAAYTVVYGKNGTSGTAQTKTFADDEECLKAAEKVLAEKIKKGYSESGEVTVAAASAAVRPESSKKSNTAEVLALYDALVKTGNVDGLLDFLKEHTKGNIEALKKQVKKAKRYWMSYVYLRDEPEFFIRSGDSWGRRGTAQQIDLIVLSAFALLNRSDMATWDEAFDLLQHPEKKQVTEVLSFAKPDWLSEFLLDISKKDSWKRLNYKALRYLEAHGLLQYHPELFALSLADFNEWSAGISGTEFIDYIIDDQVAYQRDVPQVFSYESSLNNVFMRGDDRLTFEKELTWDNIFGILLRDKKLDRNFFIEQVILVQTKDWNNNLKSFFRKRLTEQQPSPDELIIHQEQLLACMTYAYAPVANFAMELVKKIYEHEDFNITSFLDWLEPVMMSIDNKTAVKNALPILEKLNKSHPGLNQEITTLLADVYVIPDLGLQEKATKLLLKIAKVGDTDLVDKLTGYTALMQGNIRSDLSAFIGKQELTETLSREDYTYHPEKENVLLEPVQLPSDWNEILYSFGRFISSDDPVDGEILLNTFITQQHLFPEDYALQLAPYEQQLYKGYFETIAQTFIADFLRQKMKNINNVATEIQRNYMRNRTLVLVSHLIKTAELKMNTGSVIPLLSFPSHQPNWVAPVVLMERLIAFQEQGEEINAVDLSIAISRMPRENLADAILLLPGLTGEMRELMTFVLGETKTIKLSQQKLLTKILNKIVGMKEAMTGLWAVAARTFYPAEIFTEFEHTPLKDYLFVVQPFQPKLSVTEKWHEYINYQTKEKERSASWYEMTFDVPKGSMAPEHLLYSLDLAGPKTDWAANMQSAGNVRHFYSMMPQNADPLACLLLQSACALPNGDHELRGYLHVVNQAGFRFSDVSMQVFACTFFQDKKEVRLMAAEVLINLIERGVVDTALFAEKAAFLASNRYGAFQRLADGLSTVKDVSERHNLALFQILEGIFNKLKVQDKLPVNFKKMVEHYIDVLYKTRQSPSAGAKAFFETWKEQASLKALIKQILK